MIRSLACKVPALGALLLASSFASCAAVTTVAVVGAVAYPFAVLNNAPGVTIASAPPGARILIDGKDTGFVTPCDLKLPRESQRIDLVLEGYQTASRQVDPEGRAHLIYWNEAYHDYSTWHFPLWLNYQDGLVPYRHERGYSPTRIFVRMRLAGGE